MDYRESKHRNAFASCFAFLFFRAGYRWRLERVEYLGRLHCPLRLWCAESVQDLRQPSTTQWRQLLSRRSVRNHTVQVDGLFWYVTSYASVFCTGNIAFKPRPVTSCGLRRLKYKHVLTTSGL